MPKEKPFRLAPKFETLRTLFARSGNQCAFPGCTHPLIDDDDNFIGQVCHIEDAMPGERFNDNMSNEDRRKYENLILFCYPHHVKTKSKSKYSVEDLIKYKAEHESKFKEPFAIDDAVLYIIYDDLKSIKEGITEIRKSFRKQDEKHEEHSELLKDIKGLILQGQDPSKHKTEYSKEIESILKLFASKQYKSALQLLEEFKNSNWEKLSGPEKYKVIANIGICHMNLNDLPRAAECFIESSKHNPEDERALSILALGYVILDKKEEAQECIEKAIAKNPLNYNAYVALIAINKEEKSFAEILEMVPEEIRNSSEISHALGMLAQYKKDFETAIKWLQNAVDVAKDNKPDLQASLASTILESITNPFQLMTGQVDYETRNKINYCIQLLTESWNEFKDSDVRQSRAWILVNRGIARKFLKDFQGAFDDMKLSSTINENDFYTIRHLAIAAFETDKIDLSLELLNQLSSFDKEDEQSLVGIDLFKAEVLFKKKEFGQSIEILKSVIEKTQEIKIKEEALSTLIFAYAASNNLDEAKSISLKIIQENPDLIRGYIDASKVFARSNENEQALALLNTAYDKLTDWSKPIDIQDLAYEYTRHNDFPKAIDLLERITNREVYTDLTKALLNAYFNAGETAKALELCHTIRTNYGPIDLITEIQSAIYASIDDLPQAIRVCEEYLEVYPDDQKVLIRLAIICFRLKDDLKTKEILSKLTIFIDIPLEISFQLAFIIVSVGEIERGLSLGYETRKKHINIAQAHLKYIGLLNEFRSITAYLVETQKVDIDTAVKVKDERGQVQTYIILDDKKISDKDELLCSDALAKALLGKGIGDIITINRGIGDDQKFEIVAVLNKYVYAFQESIELLNTKFVDVEGFRVFNINKTGNVKDDLKPLFEVVDDAAKFDSQIDEYYKKQLLTIGSYAQIRKQNPIKIWSHILSNIDLGINCKSGIQNEIQVAHLLLAKGNDIVIDLVSLLTLASLKKLNLLETIPNTKAVARSTVEIIDEFIRELNGLGSEGFFSIGKIKGEYVKHEVTKDQIEHDIDNKKALLDWIGANCKVLPCNEALTMNNNQKEQYNRTLGRTFIDSILIAKEHGSLLFADESNIRVIALNEFQVRGLSTYILVRYCYDEGKIDLETFNDVVSKLISYNYKFLPVNSAILLKCAYIAGYKVSFPFDLALMTLDRSVSSEDSSIDVATDFFHDLYAMTMLPQVRLNLILAVLNTLINGRILEIVITKVQLMIEMKFRLLQLQKDEIQSIISDFIKSKGKR
jgi:tetratricopeptide (TPR) repeat protein/transcription elongation GreA/GreB family factor